MVVIVARLVWYRAGLGLKRFCGPRAADSVPLVQVGQDVGGFR
jgi:hypothetical protein